MRSNNKNDSISSVRFVLLFSCSFCTFSYGNSNVCFVKTNTQTHNCFFLSMNFLFRLFLTKNVKLA